MGTVTAGIYLRLAGDGAGRRVWPGAALYYAVLGFNLAVTAAIGEPILLATGLALHVGLAAALVVVARAPAAIPRDGGATEGFAKP